MKIKLVLAVMAVFSALGACGRVQNQETLSDILSSRLDKVTGTAEVDWTCFGKGRNQGNGFNSQEEYCEWERGTRNPTSKKLTCVYRTSFDQTRKYSLTSRKNDSKFTDTQFNSYAFLVGGTEPDNGIVRRGIIGHCLERKCTEADKNRPSYFGNCVPTRASDPQICQVVNQLVAKKCQIEAVQSPVATSGTPRSDQIGDKPIKLEMRLSPTVASRCRYIKDPSFTAEKGLDANLERTLVICEFNDSEFENCDQAAQHVTVVAKFKVKNSAECLK